MSRIAYVREQANKFREFAKTERSGSVREKLVALANQCDMLALAMEQAAPMKTSEWRHRRAGAVAAA